MCCQDFLVGTALGIAAGTWMGMQMKSNEKRLRRAVNRAARNVENAFDTLTG